MRVFSFGGGVQSTAALVLAAQGEIDYRTFVFANVGASSENPGTLAYLEEQARPFAAAHGLDLVEIRKHRKDGSPDNLLDWVLRDERSVKLPMHDVNGHPGRRSCTGRFKIDPIAQWQRRMGATAAVPAVTGLGISVDEAHRMRRDSGFAWSTLDYPLVRFRLTRDECRRIIQRAGLPVPPKSACWFCPYQRTAHWRTMRRTDGDTFAAAARLEKVLHDRSVALGRGEVFLTGGARPLAERFPITGQLPLFEEDEGTDACESGYCMT